jgi:hypothetical protein
MVLSLFYTPISSTFVQKFNCRCFSFINIMNLSFVQIAYSHRTLFLLHIPKMTMNAVMILQLMVEYSTHLFFLFFSTLLLLPFFSIILLPPPAFVYVHSYMFHFLLLFFIVSQSHFLHSCCCEF